VKCSECGASNLEGAYFCAECGQNLLTRDKEKTSILPFSEKSMPPTPPIISEEQLKPTTEANVMTVVIPSSGRRLQLQVTEQIRVGRCDPIKEFEPELDLTPDGGSKHGVSRLHAIIQFTERGPVLIDLNSTNGTLLNNYRLPADIPYLVRNGDEVRFGHLLVHLFFDV